MKPAYSKRHLACGRFRDRNRVVARTNHSSPETSSEFNELLTRSSLADAELAEVGVQQIFR
jgi:hypothetical protein